MYICKEARLRLSCVALHAAVYQLCVHLRLASSGTYVDIDYIG